jgi:hypothetical protein
MSFIFKSILRGKEEKSLKSLYAIRAVIIDTWCNDLQELLEHGGGETPDGVFAVEHEKKGECASLPGPLPCLKDAGCEEVAQGDLDDPFDLGGV